MCERHHDTEKRQAGGPVATILLGLIRFYQLTVSVILGRRCRYLPTCSDYAAEAVRRGVEELSPAVAAWARPT